MRTKNLSEKKNLQVNVQQLLTGYEVADRK